MSQKLNFLILQKQVIFISQKVRFLMLHKLTFLILPKSTTYFDITKIKFYNIAETDKSSHWRCSVKKGLRPATLLKKSLWHRCFLWILQNFQEYSFLQNTSGQLLLDWAFQCCRNHTFQPIRCPKQELCNEPNVYLRWHHGCQGRGNFGF